MNQDGRDDLAIYLGLQDFEVTRVEVERSRRRGRPIKVIYFGAALGSAPLPGLRSGARGGLVRGGGGDPDPGWLDRGLRDLLGDRAGAGGVLWGDAGGAAAVRDAGVPHDRAVVRADRGAVHAVADRRGGPAGEVGVGDGGEGGWARDRAGARRPFPG